MNLFAFGKRRSARCSDSTIASTIGYAVTAIITIAAGATSIAARRRSALARSVSAPAAGLRRGSGGGRLGDGAHSSASEDSDSLISLRSVLTTVFGLMFEVGESAFWIASVTSA